MDRVRAERMAAELKGKTIAGWEITDLVDYGKSALVLSASKGDQSCILKVFDPEVVERYGADVQRK